MFKKYQEKRKQQFETLCKEAVNPTDADIRKKASRKLMRICTLRNTNYILMRLVHYLIWAIVAAACVHFATSFAQNSTLMNVNTRQLYVLQQESMLINIIVGTFTTYIIIHIIHLQRSFKLPYERHFVANLRKQHAQEKHSKSTKKSRKKEGLNKHASKH